MFPVSALHLAVALALAAPPDTGITVPTWLPVFAEAEAGAYAVTFCVARDTIERANGDIHIAIDSLIPASGGPFRADCLAQPVVYVRPTCELTSREGEQFARSGAPYVVLLCGQRRWRLGLRPDPTKTV